ncbi:MAG: iron-containing alcohol dehydrogenase [Verrucomicrobia bacterium]|nr:MAG: iron-containing alcohol dehydrogenase [Verrucomicrobiota bacterium]
MPNEATDLREGELQPMEFPSRTKLIFGVGSVERVGELTRELGVKHLLLVTDAGLVAAGHAGRVQRLLEAAALRVTVFDRAKENPTTRCVEDCVTAARAAGVDGIVGLGGGSAMDTAKGCNFILTNGGRMQDYWGVGKATKPMLPFIAIPTTAGTGSELQSAALIADEVTHQKMACLDPKCAARIALLDPALTVSQPTRVTACTGIDALAHAVETAVTTKHNELSQKLSRAAFELCVNAFPLVLTQPDDLPARARMQLGAAYAGAAIENSMLGAAHAAANPLTARCGIVHGHAVGLMLPGVVRFNSAHADSAKVYEQLATAAGLASARDAVSGSEQLARRLEELLQLTGQPGSLRECGVAEKLLPSLAEEAATQWTAGFNPHPICAADFLELYRRIY